MLRPGLRLGDRYRLDTRIGAGGMGEVWRAVDVLLDRTVAVKAMLPDVADDPDFARRFLVEAKAMASVNHAAVASIHDYGHSDGLTFLVMEFVDGQSLSQLLARHGRLSPADTMHLVAQAADGLQAVHERGIVHRDIKPANLLVRPNGTLLITDFGIARRHDASLLTASGAVLGTPTYLSPEQVLGRPATPLSDVYSLGLAGYECLTGRRPFTGDNPYAIALRRVQSPPAPLGDDLPQPVRAVVERALAVEPAHRWPSAATLAHAARWSAGPLAHPPPPPPVPGPPLPAPSSPYPSSPPPSSSPSSSPVSLPPSAPAPVPPSSATPPPPAARPAAPGRSKRRQRVLLAAAVVVVLVGGAATWQGLRPDGGGSPADAGPPAPGATAPPGPSATAPTAPAGFAACDAAYCPTAPLCWGGLVAISGTAMPPRKADCAGEHSWETYAAVRRPDDAADLPQDELLAHPSVAAACSSAVLAARSVEPDGTRAWVRDAWPIELPADQGWLVHCLARPESGVSTGPAFRPA
ncbi:serine/threonine-protein kinase [Micromonospora sp. WMMD882]|uniref:serine/threonine-protein kinase n=1 Tax=Micromonospora sp. WMMD882 TaxID=3015151 RepID=UPI00248AC83D|nr:serine/threonine-protein kinase [Micromonospora sp. WMMD882]WBB81004.1 serine/threonine-protein kinase [Micromonospora sp. WMMD882]